MKVHEIVKDLLSLPNQEAEVKLIAGDILCGIKEIWKNSRPVIIEGDHFTDAGKMVGGKEE